MGDGLKALRNIFYIVGLFSGGRHLACTCCCDCPCWDYNGCNTKINKIHKNVFATIDKEQQPKECDITQLRIGNLNDDDKSGSCVICIEELGNNSADLVVQLPCKHMFHKGCFNDYNNANSLCPTCRKPFKYVVGDGPSGTMTVSKTDIPCPGYSCNFIKMYFDYKDKYTDNDESFNKSNEYCRSQKAYVPDNQLGRTLLGYYIEAFKRRFLFIWARSVTTGLYGIVFSSIHLRTQTWKNGEHGFYESQEQNAHLIRQIIESIKAKNINLTEEEALARANNALS